MNSKKPTLREYLSSAVFIIIVGVLFILNIIIPAPSILSSERRLPAKLPELSVNSVISGSFMGKFDDYAADRFVFRDAFRGIHAFMTLDMYMLEDKAGLYRSKTVGIGEFKRINATSFRQTAERIKKAAESLSGFDMSIYYTIVPDKSIFAENYMPGFDVDSAEEILFGQLGDYQYIRLIDDLSADVYYKTDLHWDQTKIEGAAEHLLSAMGSKAGTAGYSRVEAGEFRGAYAGQLALPVDADVLSYIDIPGLSVSYLNEKTLEFEAGPAYDPERFTGVDPYDIFLRGPQPLIVIENKAAPERELYLFRDSFGSSLAPLLSTAYSKITVIDLRYIYMLTLGQFIEWTPGADVLFIYSSQIFNNPSVLLA